MSLENVHGTGSRESHWTIYPTLRANRQVYENCKIVPEILPLSAVWTSSPSCTHISQQYRRPVRLATASAFLFDVHNIFTEPVWDAWY